MSNGRRTLARSWPGLAAALLLSLGLRADLARASHDPAPAFLDQSTTGVPAADGNTYAFWYTTSCPSAVSASPCDCDKVVDTDTDGDGVPDADSDNDCIATVDSDGDGVLDQAQDNDDTDGDGVADGDGVPDLVDPDWEARGVGFNESLVLRHVEAVGRYVEDWGFRVPAWTDDDPDNGRPTWVRNPDGQGKSYAHPHFVDYNAESMVVTSPRATIPHEVFHMVQHSYDYDPEGRWVREGQARSVQDKAYADMDDPAVSGSYTGSANTWLADSTYTQLDDRDGDGTTEFSQALGLEGASYDAALWWTYFTEQFGDNFLATAGEGMDAVRTYWESTEGECGGSPCDGLDAVDDAIGAETATTVTTFEDAFTDFVVANYAKELDVSAIPARDLDGRDPVGTLRYRDEERDSTSPMPYDSPVFDVDVALPGNEQQGHVNGHDVDTDEINVSPTWALPAWGARYYRGTVAGCTVAGVRVEADEDARLSYNFLAVAPDSDGDGVKEAQRLIRGSGDQFAAAVWNLSNRYDHIALSVAGLDTPAGYDFTLACSDAAIDIVSPVASAPAHVGSPDEPERFLVWLSVTGEAPLATPALAGLDWQRDFAVYVGPVAAANVGSIVGGGYVMGQYWLVVEAPAKPAAAFGDVFDLTVQLGGIASAAKADAIVYDVMRTDRVLVVDRSGSMAGDKLAAAKSAARLHTQDLFALDRLAVVSFSDDATGDFPAAGLALLPDEEASAIRDAAQEAIDGFESDGSTSIGDGLDLAQDRLDAVASDNDWWIVLLSDGMENEPASYADVRARLVDADTRIHAIALGEGAHEELMRSIALDTCGETGIDACFHHITEAAVWAVTAERTIGARPGRLKSGAHAAPMQATLGTSLADVYTTIGEDIAGHDRLFEHAGTVPAGGEDALDISLEPGMRDAVFSFHWDATSALTVALRDPGGALVVPGPGVVRLDDRGGQHVVWHVAEPDEGAWSATLVSAGEEAPYMASVSARVTQGVQMRVFLDRAAGDRWVGQSLPVVVALTGPDGPLGGALVTAAVRHPDRRAYTLTLLDDGAHHDGTAGDGVYGGAYTRVTTPGSYDISVVAEGTSPAGGTFTRHAALSYLARPDPTQSDPDGDGLPTRWESTYGLNPFSAAGADGAAGDPDEDGLANRPEFLGGTNPVSSDTDRGGETDNSEIAATRDPLDGRDDIVRPPRDVWVEPGDGVNEIRISRNATCASLELESTVDLAAGFGAPRAVDPANYLITDAPLPNGTLVFYRLRCTGAGGATSRYTPVVYGLPASDTTPPEADITIADGAAFTAEVAVTLGLHASRDTVAMQLSNSGEVARAPWVPFAPAAPWVLSADPATGQAMVYVRFRDTAGNVSLVNADTIQVEPPRDVALPALGGVLTSPDGRWRVVVPDGALEAPTIFRLTRLERPADTPPGYAYAGSRVRLDARRTADGRPVHDFAAPLQLEVKYRDWEWQDGPVLAERQLDLFHRSDGGTWTALRGRVDVTHNLVTAGTNRLSEIALFGPVVGSRRRGTIFLPSSLKQARLPHGYTPPPPEPTRSATPTHPVVATATATRTGTSTATRTGTSTATRTGTATATRTATATASSTATATRTATATTASSTATATATRTQTPTASPRPITVVITAAADSYILSSSPTTNYGGAPVVYAGRQGASSVGRSLVRFTLGGMPSGATVLSATFQAYLVQFSATPPELEIEVKRIDTPWTELGVNWNTPLTYTGAGNVRLVGQTSQYYGWDVTSLVQTWVNGAPNYGLSQWSLNETILGWRGFASRESTSPASPPQLVVVYQASAHRSAPVRLWTVRRPRHVPG